MGSCGPQTLTFLGVCQSGGLAIVAPPCGNHSPTRCQFDVKFNDKPRGWHPPPFILNPKLRISTLFLKENGVLQQPWLATTCFWAEVLGCEVVVGTLEKRLSHFARPSTYHGPIGSCPKMAKKRQNPKWHTEILMTKWGPKTVNTPKQAGSVQPSAWHSAHTC